MNTIHVPVGKDGDGEYSAATKGCFDVIDAASSLVLDSVAKQPLRVGAFHIADYGTADAGTSLGLLTKVVETLRRREGQNNKEVVIHYEDQVSNEWKSVFNHVLGNISVKDAHGRIVTSPYSLGNVFLQACGVGFHSQCFPSNTIDLGVSFTAMHWLSRSPNSLRGTEYMHVARCPEGPPEPEKNLAANDWMRILRARVAEMAPGGCLVCVNFCVSEDGYFLGQTDQGASMWDSFQTSWNQLHEQQGLISEEERLGVSFPNYYRTTREFINGIDQVEGLQLVSAEEKIVRCPYRQQYLEGNKFRSGLEYAQAFVPTTRTWSNSIFRDALDDKRTDKDAVMKQFWTNYINLVAQEPEEHGMDYVHSYLVLKKVE